MISELGISEPFSEFPKDAFAYGVSWSLSEVFVAARHDDGRNSIQVFDKHLKKLREFSSGVLKDLHQIHFINGRLWITSSGTNQVIVMDPRNGKHMIWRPNEKKHGQDHNHFNSIWFEEGLVHLVAHNFERQSEIWTFSYPKLKLIGVQKRDKYSHNVVRMPDRSLHTLDGQDRGIWGRGLAAGRNRLYIGQSKFVKDPKKRAEEYQGSVLITDYELNKINEIKINKGEVYEVRLMDEPDLAHHGRVF